MPSITSLNFNDLPEEVHKKFFDLFSPTERTLVLPTCKKWHELIIGMKAWWREVEIENEDISMDQIMRILLVFTKRSGNSLTRVLINRLIENEEELQKILSSIQSSTHSIEVLLLRQSSHLNSKTRRLAQNIPQLRMLYSCEGRAVAGSINIPINKTLRFQHYQTDILDDFQKQEEVEWLSQLEYLVIGNAISKKGFRSILQSCRANLRKLTLGHFGWDSSWEDSREADLWQSSQPIKLNALSMLMYPGWASVNPNVSLPFIAPALEILRCSLERVQVIDFSSSLKTMWLDLKDENEGEGSWEEGQGSQFIETFKSSFYQRSSVEILMLDQGYSNRTQVQFQSILQALLISPKESKEQVLLPNLKALQIRGIDSSFDFESLARTAMSREKYLFDNSKSNESNDPQTDASDVEEDFGESLVDPKERIEYLKARIMEVKAESANFQAQTCAIEARIRANCFRVEIEPRDLDIKDRMIKIYLARKKRLERAALEE